MENITTLSDSSKYVTREELYNILESYNKTTIHDLLNDANIIAEATVVESDDPATVNVHCDRISDQDEDFDLKFTFEIPKGVKGDKGEKGVKGDKGDKGEDGINGEDGEDGEALTEFPVYPVQATVYTSVPKDGLIPSLHNEAGNPLGSYNFKTNTLTTPPNWSTIIPTINSTNRIYYSYRTFFSDNTSTDWTTPMILITSDVVQESVNSIYSISKGMTLYYPTSLDQIQGPSAPVGVECYLDEDNNVVYNYIPEPWTDSLNRAQDYLGIESTIWASYNNIVITYEDGKEVSKTFGKWTTPVKYINFKDAEVTSEAIYRAIATRDLNIDNYTYLRSRENAILHDNTMIAFGEGTDGTAKFNLDGSGQLAGGLIKWGQGSDINAEYATTAFALSIDGHIQARSGFIGNDDKNGWIISNVNNIPAIVGKTEMKVVEDEHEVVINTKELQLSTDYLQSYENDRITGAISHWQLRKDGSGQLANNNIQWNSVGNVTFGEDVTLSWKNVSNSSQVISAEDLERRLNEFKETVITKDSIATGVVLADGIFSNVVMSGSVSADLLRFGNENNYAEFKLATDEDVILASSLGISWVAKDMPILIIHFNDKLFITNLILFGEGKSKPSYRYNIPLELSSDTIYRGFDTVTTDRKPWESDHKPVKLNKIPKISKYEGTTTSTYEAILVDKNDQTISWNSVQDLLFSQNPFTKVHEKYVSDGEGGEYLEVKYKYDDSYLDNVSNIYILGAYSNIPIYYSGLWTMCTVTCLQKAEIINGVYHTFDEYRFKGNTYQRVQIDGKYRLQEESIYYVYGMISQQNAEYGGTNPVEKGGSGWFFTVGGDNSFTVEQIKNSGIGSSGKFALD